MKRVFAALGVLAFAVACQQAPQVTSNPRAVLGRLELAFDAGTDSARAQALVPGSQLPFTRTLALTKTLDATNGRYFWWVRYEFTNNTGATLNNVVLVAYNKTGNAAGSALGNLRDASSGAALSATDAESFARKARPTNPMQGTPLTVSNASSDLQLFGEPEITTLQNEALAGTGYLSSGENLLPYGFALHQSRSGRSIGAGETAVVNLALSIPDAGAASNYAFNMSFLVFENPLGETRVSESIEEQGSNSGVRSRAAALGAGTTVNAVQGSALLSYTDNLVKTLPNVRIAANQNALREITVTSDADSGTGSLRDAIANLGADGIVNITTTTASRTIRLASPLVVQRKVMLNLDVVGTRTLSLTTSGPAQRLFEVTQSGYLHLKSNSKTVGLTAGRANTSGGCIHNEGTLVLRSSTLVNCRVVPSDPAQPNGYGGAIYNTGTLRIAATNFSDNSSSGYGGSDGADAAQPNAVGGNGGNGGNAYGGVIYNTGSLEIQGGQFGEVAPIPGGGSDLLKNNAQGGSGGGGGNGYRSGTTFTTAGGNGGRGGDAYGAIIYSTTAITQRDLDIPNSPPLNLTIAGQAGVGGRGSPNGSSGTAGQAFTGSTVPQICIANSSGGCQ
jgi:hypothetical protein